MGPFGRTTGVYNAAVATAGDLDGSLGRFWTATDATLDTTTATRIISEAWVGPNDWTPDLDRVIHAGGSGEWVHGIRSTTGRPFLTIYRDGDDVNLGGDATVSAPVSEGEGCWLRAEWDNSVPVVRHSYSLADAGADPAGLTWLPLGAVITPAATGAMQDSDSIMRIGSLDGKA